MKEEERITPINVHNNYSDHHKFLRIGLGLKSGLHHERPTNKHLGHGMRNYGVVFVVNGVRSYQIWSK
jgi:hypothetical protein